MLLAYKEYFIGMLIYNNIYRVGASLMTRIFNNVDHVPNLKEMAILILPSCFRIPFNDVGGAATRCIKQSLALDFSMKRRAAITIAIQPATYVLTFQDVI